jgi:hypothetical protein
MSRSQLVLRALLAAASLGMAVTTLVASDAPQLLALVLLTALTGHAAWRPESHVTSVLVALQVLHWLTTVARPDTTGTWVALLVATLLGLVVHLCAALAASLPPAAPVPPGTVVRWTRRGLVVAATTVPVWGVAFLAAEQRVAGEVSLTYAAIAAAALLALTVWLLSRDRRA